MRLLTLLLLSQAFVLGLTSMLSADESSWSKSRSIGDRSWQASTGSGSVFRFVSDSDASDGPSGKRPIRLDIPKRKTTTKPLTTPPRVPPRIHVIQPKKQPQVYQSQSKAPTRTVKPKATKVQPNVAPKPNTPVRANKAPSFSLNDDESIGDETLDAMLDPNQTTDMDSLFEDDPNANDSDIDDIKFPEKDEDKPVDESSTSTPQPDASDLSTTPDPFPTPDPVPTPDPEPTPDPKPIPPGDSPKDPSPTPTDPEKPGDSPEDGMPLGNEAPDTPDPVPADKPKPPKTPVKLDIPDKKPTPKPRDQERPGTGTDSSDSPYRRPKPSDGPRKPLPGPRPSGTDRGGYPAPDSSGGGNRPPENSPPQNSPQPKPEGHAPVDNNSAAGESQDSPSIGGDDPTPLEDLLKDGEEALDSGEFPKNTPQEVKDRLGAQYPTPKSDRERANDLFKEMGKSGVDTVKDEVIDKIKTEVGIPSLPTPIGVGVDMVTGVLGDAKTTNNGHPTDKAEIEMRDAWEKQKKIQRDIEITDAPGPDIANPEAKARRLEELQKQLDAAKTESKKAEEAYLEAVKWRYEEMGKERPQQKDTTKKPATGADNPHAPAGPGTKNKLLN